MKDRSRLISITTTCAMLVLMACVGLYYMQNDYSAQPYIKAFAYLALTVSSVLATIFLAKEEGKRELALASLCFSAIMLIAQIFLIVSNVPYLYNFAQMLIYVAMAFFVPFALCYIAKLATGKDIFEKIYVKAAILVVSLAGVIISQYVTASWTSILMFIIVILWAVILNAAGVFSIINIVKKKDNFTNWSYLFFAFAYASIYVQDGLLNLQVIKRTFYFDTLAAIAMMALGFMLVALVNKSEDK